MSLYSSDSPNSEIPYIEEQIWKDIVGYVVPSLDKRGGYKAATIAKQAAEVADAVVQEWRNRFVIPPAQAAADEAETD